MSVSVPRLLLACSPTLLFVLFLALKTSGTVDWSWWWVTAPLWSPSALVGSVWTVGLIYQAYEELS